MAYKMLYAWIIDTVKKIIETSTKLFQNIFTSVINFLHRCLKRKEKKYR